MANARRLWTAMKVGWWRATLDSPMTFLAILGWLIAYRALFATQWVPENNILFVLPPWLYQVWAVVLFIGCLSIVVAIVTARQYLQRAGIALFFGAGLVVIIAYLAHPHYGPFDVMAWIAATAALSARYWSLGKLAIADAMVLKR